jgi:hypothetical protein
MKEERTAVVHEEVKRSLEETSYTHMETSVTSTTVRSGFEGGLHSLEEKVRRTERLAGDELQQDVYTQAEMRLGALNANIEALTRGHKSRRTVTCNTMDALTTLSLDLEKSHKGTR